MLLLHGERHQRILHVLERAQDRLLLGQQRLFLQPFLHLDVRANPAGVEHGQEAEGPTEQVPLAGAGRRGCRFPARLRRSERTADTNWAFATPICAMAAWNCASLCRTSGLRLRRSEGRPTGTCAGGCGTGPGAGQLFFQRGGRARQQDAQRVNHLPLAGLQRRNRRLRRGHNGIRVCDVEAAGEPAVELLARQFGALLARL